MTPEPDSPAFDAPMGREEVHFRRIDLRGYRRDDGLFEVEGRVRDSKPYDVPATDGARAVSAGEPFHDMGVRIVYDHRLLIHDIGTFTDAAPYAECPAGGLALRALKGARMSSGWSKRVREMVGFSQGCTHLRELLGPMATVAFQTLAVLEPRQERLDPDGRPLRIDSCYAYRAGGVLTRDRWPAFFRDETET